MSSQFGLTNATTLERHTASLVLKLVYGEFSVLLTGDAGLPAERWLQAGDQPLAAQVLKVGHHGSGDSTGPGFVRAVGAPVAVIQVGENRYGHPTPAVLDGLEGRVILRNDRHGRVHMRSDGQLLWIETETGKDWMRSLAGE